MSRTARTILPLVLVLAACGTASTEPSSERATPPGPTISVRHSTDPYSIPGKAEVSPRYATATAGVNSTGNTVTFQVTNTGYGTGDYAVSCLVGGVVLSCSASASTVTVEGGASVPVTVTYDVGGSGTGTVSLLASSSLGTDIGHYYVTVGSGSSTKPKRPKSR